MTFHYSDTAKIELIGEITLTSPFSTTLPPVNAECIPKDIDRNKANATLKKGLHYVKRDNGFVAEPIITGSALRAGIRRACALRVNRCATQAGKTVGLANEYLRQTGQAPVAKAGSGEYKPAEYAAFKQSNLQAAQFGIWKHESVIEIGAGIGIEPVELQHTTGVKLKITPDYMNKYMDEKAHEDYLEKRGAVTENSNLAKEIAKLEKAIGAEKKILSKSNVETSEKLDELKESLAAKKKELEGDPEATTQENADQMLFSTHYTPEGTKFKQSIRIHDVSNSVASSLIVYGLKVMALNPQLGARKSAGWGRFKAQWTVWFNEFDQEPVELGTLVIGDFSEGDEQKKPHTQLIFKPAGELGQQWYDEAVADESWTLQVE